MTLYLFALYKTELQIIGGIGDNFFLFLNENICCDPSNKGSQHNI